MITDIETGIDNEYMEYRMYTKVYHDKPLGDDGTHESILRALADEIEEDLKRRDDLRTKARMEIYKAASDICDKYNMNITIEVSK